MTVSKAYHCIFILAISHARVRKGQYVYCLCIPTLMNFSVTHAFPCSIFDSFVFNFLIFDFRKVTVGIYLIPFMTRSKHTGLHLVPMVSTIPILLSPHCLLTRNTQLIFSSRVQTRWHLLSLQHAQLTSFWGRRILIHTCFHQMHFSLQVKVVTKLNYSPTVCFQPIAATPIVRIQFSMKPLYMDFLMDPLETKRFSRILALAVSAVKFLSKKIPMY